MCLMATLGIFLISTEYLRSNSGDYPKHDLPSTRSTRPISWCSWRDRHTKRMAMIAYKSIGLKDSKPYLE